MPAFFRDEIRRANITLANGSPLGVSVNLRLIMGGVVTWVREIGLPGYGHVAVPIDIPMATVSGGNVSGTPFPPNIFISDPATGVIIVSLVAEAVAIYDKAVTITEITWV